MCKFLPFLKQKEDLTDTLTSIENITGTNFADELRGSAGRNVLSGGDGQDQLWSRGGGDVLEGGAEADQFYVRDGDTLADFNVAEGDQLYLDRGTSVEALLGPTRLRDLGQLVDDNGNTYLPGPGLIKLLDGSIIRLAGLTTPEQMPAWMVESLNCQYAIYPRNYS